MKLLKIAKDQRPEVVAQYATGVNTETIALHFGISRNYVRYLAKQCGLPPRKNGKITLEQRHEIVCLMAFSRIGVKRIAYWYGISSSRVSAIYKEAVCRHLRENPSQKSLLTSTRRITNGSNACMATDGQHNCEK